MTNKDVGPQRKGDCDSYQSLKTKGLKNNKLCSLSRILVIVYKEERCLLIVCGLLEWFLKVKLSRLKHKIKNMILNEVMSRHRGSKGRLFRPSMQTSMSHLFQFFLVIIKIWFGIMWNQMKRRWFLSYTLGNPSSIRTKSCAFCL